MDLERQITIKNEYLSLIIGIAADYDGATNIEDFMTLVDEISSYAKMALNNEDKTVIYESYNPNGEILKSNILMEEIDIL
jgi:hypothetical protein